MNILMLKNYLMGSSKIPPLTPSPEGEGRGEAIKRAIFRTALMNHRFHHRIFHLQFMRP